MVDKVKEPTSLKDVRAFLDLVGYYPGFGKQQNLFTRYYLNQLNTNEVHSVKVQ